MIGSVILVLEWRARARKDLFEIVDYISDDNVDAAQQLKNEIEIKIAQLLENPKIYRLGRVSGTREMVVRKSYVVVYLENESNISILRILHAAQQWPPTQQ